MFPSLVLHPEYGSSVPRRSRGNLRLLVLEETGVIISTRSGLQNSICTCLNNTVMQICTKTTPTMLKTFVHRTD